MESFSELYWLIVPLFRFLLFPGTGVLAGWTIATQCQTIATQQLSIGQFNAYVLKHMFCWQCIIRSITLVYCSCVLRVIVWSQTIGDRMAQPKTMGHTRTKNNRPHKKCSSLHHHNALLLLAGGQTSPKPLRTEGDGKNLKQGTPVPVGDVGSEAMVADDVQRHLLHMIWSDLGQHGKHITIRATALAPVVVGCTRSGVVLSRSRKWRLVQHSRSQGDC